MKFSVIIPVFNRPDEVKELLESLARQTYTRFEVIIVEDGSSVPCKDIVDSYRNQLEIRYFTKPNSGPGPTRNFGADQAEGDYLVFFDSDCIIPELYFDIVYEHLNEVWSDAYGGPDMSHSSFTNIQKAISYSMTSFFTTGGIRGGKESLEKFMPRSFNMGFSRETWEATGGFSNMRFGEDVDMSIRIEEAGFTTRLIRKAAVYHKRRTDFSKFYKQVFNSGIARINLFKRHPQSLKIVHLLPSAFVVFNFLFILAGIINPIFFLPLACYVFLLFVDSLVQNKNLKVAFLSIVAAYTQLFGYGMGFISSVWQRLILKKDEFHAFAKNFYK
jgi:glycosyltransferase involved in cell wall biosynthesis